MKRIIVEGRNRERPCNIPIGHDCKVLPDGHAECPTDTAHMIKPEV